MPVITSPASPFTLPYSTSQTTSSSSVIPLGPVLPPSRSLTSSSPPSSSSSSSMSTLIATVSASADSNASSTHSNSSSAGLIVGIIILILVIAGAILFFVRRYFILKRGQKTSATRARLSRVIISEPTNFQHLGTGRVNVAAGEGGAAQISGFTVSNHQAPSRENLGEDDVVYEREDMPKDRVKRNYSYDFGTLESGLSDHVDKMRKNQKAPARI